jgi:Bacteriodetes cell division protein (FtsL-like)
MINGGMMNGRRAIFIIQGFIIHHWFKASMMATQKKSLGNYLEFGSMGASLILKNLPFVLFLSFLTVIYIANAHYAEKQVRQIQTLQNEVKELKRQYNSLKSETMFKSRLAEVGEDVESLGLRKTYGRVHRIVVED